MGEIYYTGIEQPRFDKRRSKWRGRIYHWNKETEKREYKTKTLKAKGKRAAKAEFEEWRLNEESKARAAQESLENTAAQNTLIGDYVSQFVDAKAATKAIEDSTVTGYNAATKHIREGFPNTAVKDVRAGAIEEWLADLTNEGYSSSTVGKAFRLLKQVLKGAVVAGVINRNPCDTVKPPKRENKKKGINALDAKAREELTKKLGFLEQSPVTVAALIALYTGMRRGEICALQWRDIDASSGVIWVRRSIGMGKGNSYTYIKQPKTDKGRDVSLPPTLLKTLREWRETQRRNFSESLATLKGDSYIIGDAVGYHNPQILTKEWASLARMLGVRGTEGRLPTFHDLRHTWATMFLANGGDVKTAASNLGHANAAMTLNIYASADPDAKRRAADITERAMIATDNSTNGGNSGATD